MLRFENCSRGSGEWPVSNSGQCRAAGVLGSSWRPDNQQRLIISYSVPNYRIALRSDCVRCGVVHTPLPAATCTNLRRGPAPQPGTWARLPAPTFAPSYQLAISSASMQLQALPGRARLPCSLPTSSHLSPAPRGLGSPLLRPLPLPHCARVACTLPPRRPVTPGASPQQGAGGDGGNSSDSDSEQQQGPRLWPPVMRSLDNPDSMKRQDEGEGSGSNTLVDAEPVTSSMDEPLAAAAGGQPPQGRGGGGGPLHPLQRIAIDLLSKLAGVCERLGCMP